MKNHKYDDELITAKQIKELQERSALLEEENLRLKSDCNNASLRQRFDAIHKLRLEHNIKTLCKVLNVNRSSYYKHFQPSLSKIGLKNQTFRI